MLYLSRGRDSSLLLLDDPVDDQEKDGAEGGDEDSAEIEGFNVTKTDDAAEKTAQDSADDPNQDGNEKTAWVLPRHDEFSQCPGDEAEEDPRNDAHAFEEVGVGLIEG